jgi:hypothetical protein
VIMLRIVYVLGALAICYWADQSILGGKYSSQIDIAARDAAQQFNSKIRNLLRPLGK